jgi:hypothetical protein
VENVRLHNDDYGESNFPKFDKVMPELPPFSRHVVSAREAREDREAHELLEAEQARETYMAELHCL